MSKFLFPRDAEALALKNFEMADKYPFVGELIRVRTAIIHMCHHGLEKYPGYHIVRIAQDVEIMYNNPERFMIDFLGDDVIELIAMMDEEADDEDLPYLILAICVAADHQWVPCSLLDRKTREKRHLYEARPRPPEPEPKKKGKK